VQHRLYHCIHALMLIWSGVCICPFPFFLWRTHIFSESKKRGYNIRQKNPTTKQKTVVVVPKSKECYIRQSGVYRKCTYYMQLGDGGDGAALMGLSPSGKSRMSWPLSRVTLLLLEKYIKLPFPILTPLNYLINYVINTIPWGTKGWYSPMWNTPLLDSVFYSERDCFSRKPAPARLSATRRSDFHVFHK